MNKIKIQQEHFQKLLQLVKENPDLKIVPMVATEVVADDCYAYWIANWGEARVDEIYCPKNDERVYIRSKDEEKLIDKVFNELEVIEEYKNLTAEELYEKAKQEVNNYNWEKVIVIYITV